MQTTLLGLAVALILALVTALVGPLLIDWGTYRTLFESEASHLIGVNVRVAGAIDTRLLPSPRLTLRDITIGDGKDTIRAHSLGIELALGPLLRGQWRADEMHLDGPQIALTLQADGHIQTPDIAVAFNPDALSIDRLRIENGHVVIANAVTHRSVTLEHFWFNGEARSLIGPFKGEGAATIGRELYPYRISAGRYGSDGALKIRINVDPDSHPLSLQADGLINLMGGAPRFAGTLMLSRPAEIGRELAGQLTEPWQVTGKVKATAQSGLIEDLEFRYGSEDHGFKVSGVADFRFGTNPQLNGILSARQIDLDRVVSGNKGVRAPAAALRHLAEKAAAALHPAIPIQLGFSADQVNLGGSTLQNLRGDIRSTFQGWDIDQLEFQAPGLTQVKMSGHLATATNSFNFSGPTEINAEYPTQFMSWVKGIPPVEKDAPLRVKLRGDLTASEEQIAIKKFRAEFAKNVTTGEVAYHFAAGNRPAKLETMLKTPDLDVDAALTYANALLSNLKVERPRDMAISADVGRVSFGKFTGHNATVRLNIDDTGLQIDNVAVTDFGGASFSAGGRFDTGASLHQNAIHVDLNAPDLTPLLALLSRFAPDIASMVGRQAAVMSPAKLHGQVTFNGTKPKISATFLADGHLGQAQLALRGKTGFDLATFDAGDLHIDGKMDAPDGKVLSKIMALDRVFSVEDGPGVLRFAADRVAHGALSFEGKFSAGKFASEIHGTANPFAIDPSFAADVSITHADLAPITGKADVSGKIPFMYKSHAALANRVLALDDINASIGSTDLRGRLKFSRAKSYRVDGEVDIDRIDSISLLASAIGMPPPIADGNSFWSWSNEPFSDRFFGNYSGSILVKAKRFDLLPSLAMHKFQTMLHLDENEVALNDIVGELAKGKLSGALSFHRGEAGLKTRAKIQLADADAAGIFSFGARPPATGLLALETQWEGLGLSPVALIGSLHGEGRITLTNAALSDINPKAFNAVSRIVDEGASIDASRISNVASKALQSGQMPIKHVQSTIAINAGQIRLDKTNIKNSDADLGIAGTLDLTNGQIDARLVLSGADEVVGTHPDLYVSLKGPVATPSRAVDASALIGWLTLRNVEKQAKKLETIERSRSQPEAAAPVPTTASLPSSKSETGKAPLFPPLSPPPLAPASASAVAPDLPPPVTIIPLPRPRSKPVARRLPKSINSGLGQTLFGGQ